MNCLQSTFNTVGICGKQLQWAEEQKESEIAEEFVLEKIGRR